jgi:molybdopterin/thiamine biosynthesis adenylyltransferase
VSGSAPAERAVLGQKRALLVGAGGLGCPSALVLARAGVGTLGLSDSDRIDLSNLHRQILYALDDLERPKTEQAAKCLENLAAVRVERLPALPLQAIEPFLRGWDVILDGTDSIEMKFALSDAAVRARVPLIHAGVVRQRGLLLTVLPGGPCYRCLFEEPPPPGEVVTCQEAGVIGAAAGWVGALQAAEALKVLLGQGAPLSGRFLDIDLSQRKLRVVPYPKNPRCIVCSAH